MSIMEKFANVKVDAAARIGPEDAAYCEAEQVNYDRAHKLYADFRAALAEGIKLENEEWSSRTGKSSVGHRTYAFLETYGDGGLGNIEKRVDEIQTNFIHGLVYYFAEKYNVSLSAGTVDKNLGLEKPEYDRHVSESRYENALAEYKTKSTRRLHYNEIVDEVLLQLGGLTFSDKAVQQIKDNAQEAAHNKYHNHCHYTINKKVIQFKESFTHYDGQHSHVLLALWHFNTGLTSMGGSYWSRELDKRYSYYSNDDRVGSPYEFEGQKACKMRYFKSGRWDITFASAELADTFAREYLGY